MSSQDEETMAKIGNILLKSADECEADQDQLKAANYHFLACYEDSSFLYRRAGQQRKHSRRLKSCGASSSSASSSPSSPSSYQNDRNSKSSSNTTADSMLTPATFRSSSSGSSCSPSDISSPDSLSPFTLMMKATTTTMPTAGRKRQSPDSSIGTSASELTPPAPVKATTKAATNATRNTFARGSSNYFDDEQVFYNLILKERADLKGRERPPLGSPSGGLTGELRHSLLAWMLKVCEHQLCQDEIFPLATMILEKFLQLNPISKGSFFYCFDERKQAEPKEAPAASGNSTAHTASGFDSDTNSNSNSALDMKRRAGGQPDDQLIYLQCAGEEANELARRQLCLFAACSLLLATKLRQTPRLCIQTLIDFSRLELPIELSREEILDGEILVLSALKWDLAALVTPNDFLQMLARKCQSVLAKFLHANTESGAQTCANSSGAASKAALEDGANKFETENKCQQQQHKREQQQQQRQLKQQDKLINRCDESRVRRHTQTLLELCLMGKFQIKFTLSARRRVSSSVPPFAWPARAARRRACRPARGPLPMGRLIGGVISRRARSSLFK